MCAEENKTEGHAEGQTHFTCKPENFQNMFEMMSTYCAGENKAPDCSSMMKKMMEHMKKQACGGPATETNKAGGTTS